MPLMERFVPEAFVKVVFWRLVSPVAVRLPAVMVPPVMVLAWSVPPVATVNCKSPVMDSEVPVAFVKVVFWSELVPFAIRRPLIVAVVLKTKSAVEVPPANWMAFVVVLPALVTVCRFGVVPVGQFVPFARHTNEPFTYSAVELTSEACKLVPVAFVKLSVATVPDVDWSVVIVPLRDTRLSITLYWAYKLVEVVLVPVAFTHVISVRLSGPVRMRFVIVAVVALKVVAVAEPVIKELVVRFVMVEEEESRFVMVPVVAESVRALIEVAERLVTPRFTTVP